MSKRKMPHKHCEKYLNNRVRIHNKEKALKKRLVEMKKNRNEEVNPNTKKVPVKGSIENVIKSCRIGRQVEGFQQEDIKHKPRKAKKILNVNLENLKRI